VGKKKYLTAELGENSVDLMRQLKNTLDPDNVKKILSQKFFSNFVQIMNPGKVLPNKEK
jgi:hypothetical protein